MEIVTAFTALRIALDGLRGASEASTKAVVEEAISKARSALVEAQETALQLQADAVENLKIRVELEKEITKLRTELAEIDDWKKKAACYTLAQALAGSMTWVRTFDPEKGKENGLNEPFHMACPLCFEKRQRFILFAQYESSDEIKCPNCKFQVQYRPFRPVPNMIPQTEYDPLS